MTRARHAPEAALARAFVHESRRRLRREYLPKLRRALVGLSASDIWWRPNSASNSIGNLLVHLEGNIRQWMIAGIGGRRDRRDRDAEFACRTGGSARVLLARLDRTLREVDAVLAGLGAEELLELHTIQGYRVTGLQAVYHIVEHFSGHTGQILYIVKQRRARDLGFYAHLAGPAPRARSIPRPRRRMPAKRAPGSKRRFM